MNDAIPEVAATGLVGCLGCSVALAVLALKVIIVCLIAGTMAHCFGVI